MINVKLLERDRDSNELKVETENDEILYIKTDSFDTRLFRKDKEILIDSNNDFNAGDRISSEDASIYVCADE